jgi:putative membrane protein
MRGVSGYTFWGQLIGLLFTALVILGFTWLLINLIKKAGTEPSRMASRGTPQGQNAQEIIRRRYARGEISREEYQQILRDLQ